MNIIDIHAHTSNHPMRNLHTTDASIESLRREAERHGIITIVLLATYFPHKGTGVHNLDLLKRIDGDPLFLAFGSLDVPNDFDNGLAELEQLAREEKISGIKLYPGYQGFEPSDLRLDKVYDLAKKYRLPIMFHGGELHNCDPALEELARPQYIETPAKKYPTVKFIVSHLSYPYFSELRGVMERCPNVYTDISGIIVSGSEEAASEAYREGLVSEIRQFLECPNGIERVAFATDFPIQSYADTLDLVNRLCLEGQDLKNILSENALRILDKNHMPRQS